MAEKHLVIVPHTHWDREWYMPFEDFRKRLVGMMDRLLDTLEEDPKFKYFELDGQTIVLSDYLEIRPENESRLRRLIQKGRIIIGPWYVQPDEFLVSGESIIRNFRIGIKDAKKFGKPSMIGYVPDQFGHIAQMPQILLGFGMKTAIMWRGVGETVNNTQFLWEAPDGSRIFTIYLADSYSNGAYLPLKQAELKKRLNDMAKRLEDFCDIKSILIMNGLDHLEAQPGLPAQLAKAVEKIPDSTFEMGNLNIFVKQARKQSNSLAIHQGEFRSPMRAPLLPGVTSARVRQKQLDFQNCGMLEKYVEPLCAWASICGDKRPHANFLEQAWRLTIRNHPHDSICGCSVDPVHEEMENRFEKAKQIGEGLKNDGLSFLAGLIDSSWVDKNDTSICVFNPTAAQNQVVDLFVDVEEPDFINSLRNKEGSTSPLQKTIGERELFLGAQFTPDMLREQVAGMEGRELIGFYINDMLWRREGSTLKLNLIMDRAPTGDDAVVRRRRRELLQTLDDTSIEMVDVKGISGARTRLSFFVKDLAPLGLSVFSCSDEDATTSERSLACSPEKLENDFYSITINENGTLDILDKEIGVEYKGCLHFVDEGDRGDSYNFDYVPDGEVVDKPSGPINLSIEENGPVRATVRLEIEMAIPEKIQPSRDSRSEHLISTKISTSVSIYRDIKRIDFKTTLDNQCEDHRLRVIFNAPFATSEIITESAFGVVRRPSKVKSVNGYVEQPIGTGPQKTFSCIENRTGGLALFNRGVPEIEAASEKRRTKLALTLVRSVGWLSRDDLNLRPDPAGPELEAPGAQSFGPHTFEYAFTSYKGDYAQTEIAQRAHSYAFPPIATVVKRQRGRLKDGLSLVEVDNPNIVVSAIELSRRRGAYLARLYNTTESEQEALVNVWGRNVSIFEVNLAEKRLSKEPIAKKGGRLSLSFQPGEIKTLQVAPKK